MPPPRLPTPTDFPPNTSLTIIPPSSSQTPVNVLLLLHGLGDTHHAFASLGRSLNLPYTVCISLCGPSPLPPLLTGNDAPSFHWGDDILFDEHTGAVDLEAGFEKARKLLIQDVLRERLLGKCGFKERDVVMLGWGQGAMAALDAVAKERGREFGGVVSVGGRLPATSAQGGGKSKTPVLVLGGSRSSQVTKQALEAMRQCFEEVEYVKWSKGEDSMPKNREEMLPIMRFFARRLRAGVPEGAVELT